RARRLDHRRASNGAGGMGVLRRCGARARGLVNVPASGCGWNGVAGADRAGGDKQEKQMSDIGNLWKFDLRKGNSNDPRNGACVMDAVSWFEYGKLGDHPECVCPVIAAFVRPVNDFLDDANRQRLKLYIPRFVGTVDPASEQARAEYLAWQAIRVFAPIALDAAGLKDQAARLREFKGTLKEAPQAVWEAEAAAWAAAEAAAARARAAAAEAGAARAAAGAAAEAAEAAAADKRSITAAVFAALDGVLAIGCQAEPIEAARFQQAVDLFAMARGEAV